MFFWFGLLYVIFQADLDNIKARLDRKLFHVAPEFTTIAISGLGRTDYSARPLVGLPHCKEGGKQDQHTLIKAMLNAW